jgi:hypothetical protein
MIPPVDVARDEIKHLVQWTADTLFKRREYRGRNNAADASAIYGKDIDSIHRAPPNGPSIRKSIPQNAPE